MGSPFGPMKPPKSIPVTFQAVVAALIKSAGIHEGLYRLQFEFSLMAVNVGISATKAAPAAVVPIKGMALVRVDPDALEKDPGLRHLVVDAAEANPERRIITSVH